jgi:glycerol uptake facilitator-like aquaporin
MAPKLGSISNESFLLHLMSRIDAIRLRANRKRSMTVEIRTLEFWRAIIAECLSSFFYVFLLCATHISWTGSQLGHQPNWLVMSFTSGCAMATLSQCFGHISGAHVNPAVTCALFITSKITPLRALLYVIAQCGGSIAGAALLYG